MKRCAALEKSFTWDESNLHCTFLTGNITDKGTLLIHYYMHNKFGGEMSALHPPEFGFVEHAFGLLVGNTYQGLLVNGNELISGPETSILCNQDKKAMPSILRQTSISFNMMEFT